MQDQVTVGVVANPASGRDIRRLVAHASAVTAHQKLNLLKRLVVGLGRAGVDRVLMMPDPDGIAEGFAEAGRRASASGWPAVELLDQALTGSPIDTTIATRRLVADGVGAIVVLGGDGTHRLVALHCGDTPIVAISTGTNNAFPQPLEPTVAGMAAGLVATGRIGGDASAIGRGVGQGTGSVIRRAKMLEVRGDDERFGPERALVDVAVVNTDRVGAGAVWDPNSVEEVFLCFAAADGVGLSAIGGHLQPVGRDEPMGLAVRLAPRATGGDGSGDHSDPLSTQRVRAPIGPGLMADVDVASWSKLAVDQPVTTSVTSGTIAVDGERIARFGSELTVTLRSDGPMVVDVAAVLDSAARSGLLTVDTPVSEGGH